jgi:hypothetical protein
MIYTAIYFCVSRQVRGMIGKGSRSREAQWFSGASKSLHMRRAVSRSHSLHEDHWASFSRSRKRVSIRSVP